MESRNVKIVDEHGIDRDGHVICGLKVSNADYVLYSIERDGENNNLFISKVINNFDGTSNMINIDDTAEKTKLNDIVKELVTYAINNEADKVTGTVNLPSGAEVTINSLTFNKEQNINVGKTYITTVKKNVTKVCDDFYDVPSVSPANQESTFFDTVKDDIFDNNTSNPVPEPMPELNPEPAEPAVVEPVLPVPPVPETPVIPPVPPVSEVPPVPSVPAEPVQSAPVVPEPVVAPIFDTTTTTPAPAPAPSDLVFDGSKETNLNQALGEVSTEKTVAVDDVAPLRDFGQSDVLPAPQEVPPVVNPEPAPEVPGNSGGFANKKFFMVIAILFFVAACVFLGYEAFMYFQLTK